MNLKNTVTRFILSISALFFVSACGTNFKEDFPVENKDENAIVTPDIPPIVEPDSPQSLNNSNKIGKLKVSEDKRMISYADGTGFFWMGDTAWSISVKFHEKENKNALIDKYMQDRKAKGFSVIQTSAVPERWLFVHAAFENPNSEGVGHPGIDFKHPIAAYWKMMDYIVESARQNNLYVALLPIWHDVLFTLDEAKAYGTFIANRYKDKENIIWVNGGDTDAKDPNEQKIWTALGETIKNIDPNHLMTFHAGSGALGEWLLSKERTWLDFYMVQSGHSKDIAQTDKAFKDNYSLLRDGQHTIKPILDGEPRYEMIHKSVGGKYQGDLITADEVRSIAYIDLFSGAFGHTYGHQSIWQMHDTNDKVGASEDGSISKTWQEALNDEGARQMTYVTKLMRSRPILNRIPDQAIIKSGNAIATQGVGYAFIYLPKGGAVNVNLGTISGEQVKAWWFNPKTGDATAVGTYANKGTREFTTGVDDMVLVLDDTSKNYATPGQ